MQIHLYFAGNSQTQGIGMQIDILTINLEGDINPFEE